MSEFRELEQQHWDFLVIGTGIGGATLGHALSKAGGKLLFLEKGRAHFRHADTLRGAYPESCFPHDDARSARHARSTFTNWFHALYVCHSPHHGITPAGIPL